jgi:hypothetical protein
MPIAAQNILAGVPDQLTTGAILSAPMTVPVPTDAQMWADTYTGFEDSGFVSEDGLAMNLSKSFENIKDWSGTIVKRILSEFDGTIKYAHLQIDEFSLKDAFGDSQVTITPATAGHGTRYKTDVGAVDLPSKRRIFKMKDGLAKVRILVPNGVVTELEDLNFVKTDAIKLGTTLGCQPDEAGNLLYLFIDDGVVAVSGS